VTKKEDILEKLSILKAYYADNERLQKQENLHDTAKYTAGIRDGIEQAIEVIKKIL